MSKKSGVLLYTDRYAPLYNFILERPVSEVSFGAKACYAKLAQHCGDKDYCWPKLASLAKSLGCSPRQCQNFIAELVGLKLIAVESRRAAGKSNVYRTLNHPWMPARGEEASERSCTPLTKDVALGGTNDRSSPEEYNLKNPDLKKQSVAAAPNTTPLTRQAVPRERLEDAEDDEEHVELPSREEGQLGTDSREDSDSSADQDLSKRKGAAEDAVQAIIAKNRAQREANLRKTRVRDQRTENLKSTGPKEMSKRKVLGRLETVWRTHMRSKFAGITFADWEGKERGQAQQLVDKYSGPIIEHALEYLVTRWDQVQTRFLRGKGTVPSLGLLLKMHDILVPEAQRWAELSGVQKEWDRWFVENPDDRPPTELRERFERARKELGALGAG